MNSGNRRVGWGCEQCGNRSGGVMSYIIHFHASSNDQKLLSTLEQCIGNLAQCLGRDAQRYGPWIVVQCL